jgi:MFS family permease
LAQGIPRLLFSLVGGVFADVLDRRRLLLVVNVLLACTSAALALCTSVHVIDLAIIFGMVLVASSVSAFEFPTRQAVIPSLIPRERMADAFALNSAAFGLTVIVGAAAGGVVLARVGVANTYWVDVVSYVVVLGALALMTVPRSPVERRARAGVAALSEGVRFVRSHPVILAMMALDFFATFFGSPRAAAGLRAGHLSRRCAGTGYLAGGDLDRRSDDDAAGGTHRARGP